MADVAASIRASTLPRSRREVDISELPTRHGGSFATGIISGLSDAISNFAKTAKGSWTGEVDPLSDESIGSAFELASNLAGAGSAKAGLSKPDPSNVELGIFAGTGARTADHRALIEALDMRRSNLIDDDTILQSTGWFKGMDGQWRFEIDDSASVLKPMSMNDRAPLGEVLKHDELFAAYPDLAQTIVQASAQTGGGRSFAPGGHSYPAGFVEISPQTPGRPMHDQLNPHSVLLHELQHQVQAREGFSGGANPDWVRNQVIAKANENPTDAQRVIDVIRTSKVPDLNTAIHRLYARTAGEVEANQVQQRFPMSAMERRMWHPMNDPPPYLKSIEEAIVPFRDIND